MKTEPIGGHDLELDRGARSVGNLLHRYRFLLSALAYTGLAQALFGFTTPLGGSVMSGAHTADQIQQVWFLEWGAHAVSNGLNPLFSSLMNHPVGINLAANNSMTALSLPFAPITHVFGAVATWNVLLRLAVITSALAAQAAFGRVVRWAPAAFIGGIIYAFSGYMTFWAGGYLLFLFVPFPPLVFMGLHAIFVRGVKRPFVVGALTGLALCLEYLISPEIAAVTAVMAAATVLVAVVGWRDQLQCGWHEARSACLGMALVLFVLLAYPIGFARWGPANLNGFSVVPSGSADALGLISPGPRMQIHPGPQVWEDFGHYFFSAPLYLGIPAVVGALVVTIWLRNRPIVLASGILASISGLLSLGSELVVHGKSTGIPLPFALIAHVPVLSYIVPARFAIMTAFFVALVLAFGLDALRWRFTQADVGRRPVTMRAFGFALPVVVAAAVLLPLLPASSVPAQPPPISKFFTSPAVHRIPDGATVLTYPYPDDHGISASTSTGALLDQVAADMRFRLVGGYGWMPPQRTTGFPAPTPLPPISVQGFFTAAFLDRPLPWVANPSARVKIQRELKTFLMRYEVSSIVVDRVGSRWTTVAHQITAVLGSPDISQSNLVWFDVPSRLGARWRAPRSRPL